MKKLYATLFIISLGLFVQVNAQTLKNIHRHNLPILQIPIDLIDKVETVDVSGQKFLKVIQLSGFVNEVPIVQIDSITHTDGTALDPSQLGNLRTASVMGVVNGPTGAPEMGAIVRSPYGGEETKTDQNGVFFLSNIIVYDKLGYITITKPGFHQGSRSFLPLETGSNRVNIQLFPMIQSGTFNAAAGGTVTSGLVQLNFPANSVELNGQPYSGTVRVYAEALNPTSPAMFDQMPGELLGGLNDSLRLLRSFGMATIELRDANMNELQLAEGVSATLRFTIPSALLAEAPQTIDWWSFDEALGYWKHEGEAQKQGNQYIGLATHFSWWNVDVPQNFNEFRGTIRTEEGIPISDAKINVVTQAFGTGVTYTNAVGEFSGRVPKNQLLILNIFLICSSTDDWALAYTEELTSEESSISGTYTALLGEYFPITGTVVNCQGQAVESGYVKMGSRIFTTNNGIFTIQACATGEYVIRGYNTTIPDSITTSAFDTVQVGTEGINVGELQACTLVFGVVSDIDGNEYATVLIGNQVWMAENLKAARFSDGSEIPNVTDNVAWDLLTPAWCNYNNNLAYDSLYGKLYNWFTTVDPRNVCPTGWHVPSDEEWTILYDFLGGLWVSGGKMKSVSGWNPPNPPNTGTTNESGFSGLPGGHRNEFAEFDMIGDDGSWWSSTEANLNLAWSNRLNYNYNAGSRINAAKTYGRSIRCLKD